ncbi:predicted protein [Sclerotinia sclerotiorum 1980 UF-70]|uniref:Uncharacterized protein n=2 Tax=Sclerotinia sclerotiorum (strain ATCC 18683 / 1980 / Ss-1) TaxID=665079 RepID=A0A1D9QC68_SCLS1|nr:predicted protein [Sclerotinia sclerotiorum 1980 UF-70]APA12544.1 hypothetical protein sscle_09g073140 [Sclerotinia sclerotiorum 1980 UF-70]EDO01350.1 predicted protein [Sclerotinia sclerotiorum 1980 UF-70]
MDYDIKTPVVIPGNVIKRKSLPSPAIKEKPSIAFQSPDYDPTEPPAYMKDPYPEEKDIPDTIFINPTITSTPTITSAPSTPSTASFPLDRLVIPTKTDSLASGFPYHQRLCDYRVTHDEWHIFTNEIVKAASLSLTEDWAAWTAGISTGVLSTGLLVFGGPVAGYYTGRSVHRKKVLDKVKDGLMHEGSLRSTLHKWNEQTFRDKGFQAWLELPVVKGEINGEEDEEQKKKKKSRKERKLKEKERRRFRIVIVSNNAPMGMIMGNQQSTWSLVQTDSIQQSEIVEAPDTGYRHPGVAELA